MLSSLQARMMRTAISPRLATRIFSNMTGDGTLVRRLKWPNLEDRLAEFDRFSVIDEDFSDHSANLCFDFVHHFHGLDDANDRVGSDLGPNLDVVGRFRRRSAIQGPDHGGFDLEFAGNGTSSMAGHDRQDRSRGRQRK